MKFNSRANSASYMNAGQLSGNSSAGIFQNIKDASPDYAGLIKKLDEIKTSNKRALLKQEGKIGTARMDADVIRTRQKTVTDLEVAQRAYDRERKFAGFLSALGGDVVNTYLDLKKGKKEEPPTKKPYTASTKFFEERIRELEDKLTDYDSGAELPPPFLPNGEVNPIYLDVPNSIENTQTSGVTQPATPAQTAQPVALYSSIPTGNELNPPSSTEMVRNTFLKVGASPEVANVFATKIVPRESKNIANNTTYASGLYADTGESSYGWTQINMYDTDPRPEYRIGERNRRMQMFGISDPLELLDPEVNARAALKILDEQGFNAWTTYY